MDAKQYLVLAGSLVLPCAVGGCGMTSDGPSAAAPAGGWIELFDGMSTDGWKASENVDSFWVEDGALVAHGPRSHLFHEAAEPFVNFELEAEVMTKVHSNSGIYFHTRFQAEGWPRYGLETQINNTDDDPQKTGSLYGVVKILEAPARDDEWFKVRIRVEGKRVTVHVDDELLVDYTEAPDAQAGEDFTRVLDKGTFALQAHDPESTVYYRRIRVRRLP